MKLSTISDLGLPASERWAPATVDKSVDRTLMGALGACWERRWLVAAVVALSAFAAIIYIAVRDRPYRAETSLLFVFHGEYANLSVGGDYDTAIRVGLAEAIGSEMHILNSRTLHRKVIERIDLDTLFSREDKPGAVAGLWTATVGQPFGLNELTQSLMNALGIAEWLGNGELEAAGGVAPDRLERAVETFARNLNIRRIEGSNIVSVQYSHVDPAVAATLLNTMVDLFRIQREMLFEDANRLELERETEVAEARLREAEELRNAFVRESRSIDLEEQTRQLTVERAVYVQELANPKNLITPTIRQEMRGRIRQIDAQLQTIARNYHELERLQRNYDAALKTYDMYRSMLENTRLLETMRKVRQPTIRVIDPAVPPVRASGFGTKATLALALTLGVLAGLALAVALGPRHALAATTAFPRVRAVERCLGVPVLAIVDQRFDDDQ